MRPCAPLGMWKISMGSTGGHSRLLYLRQSSRNIPAYGRTIQPSPGKNILMAVAVVMSSAVALSTP